MKKVELESVTHQNFVTNSGRVFCKKVGKVIELDCDKCDKCEYLYGSLQGDGVECRWDDPVKTAIGIYAVHDPNKELLRVSQLIDKGIIKRG